MRRQAGGSKAPHSGEVLRAVCGRLAGLRLTFPSHSFPPAHLSFQASEHTKTKTKGLGQAGGSKADFPIALLPSCPSFFSSE
jgi:hypothetical protein